MRLVKSWIEVSERRLRQNYRAAADVVVQEAGAGSALLAVIKANGYGHGAALCAPVLARAGAPWLGVTDAMEGTAVRVALEAAGIEREAQPRILVMCAFLAEDAARIVEQGLTPVVWAEEQLAPLLAACKGQPLAVHVEIDTGMSRQGVPPGDGLRELLRELAAGPLRVEGVMSHLASAELAHAEQTCHQRKQFEAAVDILREEGVRPEWMHVGNTSAIDNGADGGTLEWLGRLAASMGARAMVRSGLALYGYTLPLEGLAASDGDASRLHAVIEPVMAWKTKIAAISEVALGSQVGYGGTFEADEPMRLALLPVGYADGLRRELSRATEGRGGWVMIHGRRAPVVGRVSMNLTTVDVTAIPGAMIGDEVILLGEGITAKDHAALAHTISYEIVCAIRGTPVLAE